MWRAPNRANNKITQGFNDGRVTVYGVEDGARPGFAPKPKLTRKIALNYEEQRLGIQRYYAGQQNQVRIERVIRCPRMGEISSQDVAVTEDGRQYRVDLVQSVQGIYPPSVDVTLAKIDQRYEVMDDVV